MNYQNSNMNMASSNIGYQSNSMNMGDMNMNYQNSSMNMAKKGRYGLVTINSIGYRCKYEYSTY